MKTATKRFILILLAAMLLIPALAGCTQTQKTKTLVMGLDDSFPPMGYRDENGDIVGFDIDLATEACKRIGYTLELQPIDWDSKELELESGNIDCVWNGMTINEERLEAMTISKPYLRNSQLIVVLEDSDILTLGDLEGLTVGVQKGSSAVDALQSNPVYETLGESVEFTDNVTALLDLKQGGLDALAVDEVLMGYYLNLEPGVYRVLDETLGEEEYGIGFKKGNDELCDLINGALADMISDGSAADISIKWFGEDILISE